MLREQGVELVLHRRLDRRDDVRAARYRLLRLQRLHDFADLRYGIAGAFGRRKCSIVRVFQTAGTVANGDVTHGVGQRRTGRIRARVADGLREHGAVRGQYSSTMRRRERVARIVRVGSDRRGRHDLHVRLARDQHRKQHGEHGAQTRRRVIGHAARACVIVRAAANNRRRFAPPCALVRDLRSTRRSSLAGPRRPQFRLPPAPRRLPPLRAAAE